jgi:hypothetical protein
MNVIDLMNRCGLYQCDLEDWDCKPKADKTWINLCPFIQEVYQRRLQLGTMTTSQGGYASQNCFASFTATNKEYIFDDDKAKTIAGTISSYFANLSVQRAAMIEANTSQVNACLQQLANNNAQLQQQQQAMMQQMALLSTNATMPCNNAYVQPPTQIYAPPPLQGFQQQYQQRGDGRGGRGHSCGGHPRCGHSGGGRGIPMPTNPFMGCNVILYIPAGVQPTQQRERVHFSNFVKMFANQNVCCSCGFDVEDWHTSATCNDKKQGHQDGFNCTNYMEYECAKTPFCCKAMYKTIYLSF